MAEPPSDKPEVHAPAPSEIEIRIDGQPCRLSFEQAFVIACSLLERGKLAEASKLFNQLEEFEDRGPRAFIMHAFCECAARNFEESKLHLDAAFNEEQRDLASSLQDAFVSCHVGIRKEGLKMIADLVDKHLELPSLCLVLGNMLHAGKNFKLAQRCWTLAIQRDRPQGAVAKVAAGRLRKLTESPPADASGTD